MRFEGDEFGAAAEAPLRRQSSPMIWLGARCAISDPADFQGPPVRKIIALSNTMTAKRP
jgi:hypothetical protein